MRKRFQEVPGETSHIKLDSRDITFSNDEQLNRLFALRGRINLFPLLSFPFSATCLFPRYGNFPRISAVSRVSSRALNSITDAAIGHSTFHFSATYIRYVCLRVYPDRMQIISAKMISDDDR